MNVSIQVSLYPLDGAVGKGVREFVQIITDAGLDFETGSMSTIIRGEMNKLWPVLQAAFEEVSAQHPVVMTITVSNACPIHKDG